LNFFNMVKEVEPALESRRPSVVVDTGLSLETAEGDVNQHVCFQNLAGRHSLVESGRGLNKASLPGNFLFGGSARNDRLRVGHSLLLIRS
jgi:hypothetical protein